MLKNKKTTNTNRASGKYPIAVSHEFNCLKNLVFLVNTNIGAMRRLIALKGRKFVIRKP